MEDKLALGEETNIKMSDRATDTKTPEQLKNEKLLKETKMLKDTLDLMWNKTMEQQQVCDNLDAENNYLREYIKNFMASSNVLER